MKAEKLTEEKGNAWRISDEDGEITVMHCPKGVATEAKALAAWEKAEAELAEQAANTPPPKPSLQAQIDALKADVVTMKSAKGS